jgi:FMN-dependent NADH-azoreductase
LTRLLYIQASPRGLESKSAQMAEAYLDARKEHQPAVEVDVLRLWDERLPAFDGNKVAAKMKVIAGQSPEAEHKTEWDEIVSIVNRFVSADHYLLAVPMWNSGVPYPLKHYIDLVHQPGLLWRLDAEAGYIGLLRDKRATLMLTAGAFAPHFPSPAFGIDHHSTHLRDWLTQAGVGNIDEVRFDANLLIKDAANEFEKAKRTAADLARKHAAY